MYTDNRIGNSIPYAEISAAASGTSRALEGDESPNYIAYATQRASLSVSMIPYDTSVLDLSALRIYSYPGASIYEGAHGDESATLFRYLIEGPRIYRHGYNMTYKAVGNVITFVIEEAEEGGFTAYAEGESIFTEADDLETLKENIREAIDCHFDENKRPAFLMIREVREEIIAL